jgi:hypothetical protein
MCVVSMFQNDFEMRLIVIRKQEYSKMRIPQKTNKDTTLIVAGVILFVSLFVFLQKYENARFHKEVNPKMFSQNMKAQPTREMASVQE